MYIYRFDTSKFKYIFPGYCFGYQSLISNKPFQYSIKAITHSTVYVLYMDDIIDMIKNETAVGSILQDALSKAIFQQEKELGLKLLLLMLLLLMLPSLVILF